MHLIKIYVAFKFFRKIRFPPKFLSLRFINFVSVYFSIKFFNDYSTSFCFFQRKNKQKTKEYFSCCKMSQRLLPVNQK